jgi:hypothetical protein
LAAEDGQEMFGLEGKRGLLAELPIEVLREGGVGKTGDPVGGYVPAGSARLFVGLGGGSACVNVRCSGGRWGLCVLVMMELRYLWGTST